MLKQREYDLIINWIKQNRQYYGIISQEGPMRDEEEYLFNAFDKILEIAESEKEKHDY